MAQYYSAWLRRLLIDHTRLLFGFCRFLETRTNLLRLAARLRSLCHCTNYNYNTCILVDFWKSLVPIRGVELECRVLTRWSKLFRSASAVHIWVTQTGHLEDPWDDTFVNTWLRVHLEIARASCFNRALHWWFGCAMSHRTRRCMTS
jgi:hypothetical protein